MGFRIIQGSPQIVWAPITDSDTLYIGQIVKCAGNEGVQPAGTASGAADTTGKGVLYGIVVGNNNKTPVYNSTYRADYITDATPKASTTVFTGVEGPWSKGDKQAMVQIAILTPTSVVRGNIWRGAVGTALPENTVKASNAHYANCTIDSTPKSFMKLMPRHYNTAYFRTGANAGTYRLLDSASTIGLTWDKNLFASASHDDKVIIAKGLRSNGYSKLFVDSESMYIDNTVSATTSYYVVNVLRLDLREQGKEFCDFMFLPEHFSPKRT